MGPSPRAMSRSRGAKRSREDWQAEQGEDRREETVEEDERRVQPKQQRSGRSKEEEEAIAVEARYKEMNKLLCRLHHERVKRRQ